MKLTIVIVNWNTGKLLSQCLESIQSLPEKTMISEVMVIDNKSKDDSWIIAKRVEIGVPTTFVALPENVGFAAANNVGIRQRRDKASHVLLLNPDTQVKAGGIAAGLHELEHHEKTGIVGVKLVNPDGTIQPSVRNLPTFPVLLFLFFKLQRLFPSAHLWQQYMRRNLTYEERHSVGQVMGAAFLIRREVLEEIGLLDEKFWVWFEEVDFCTRAKKAGWQVVYTPSGSIMHYGGVSFNQLVGLSKTLPFLKSALRYARKHLSWIAFGCLLLVWPFSVCLALPALIVHIYQRQHNPTRV
jgi:GT2 family glycosyltransferase